MLHENLCMAKKGKFIASGTVSGHIRIFDYLTGFIVATLEAHESRVTDLVFSDEETLYSCGDDGVAYGYDLKKYKKFRTFRP